MRVAIVGSGLSALSAAVDLVDAGHAVDLYEARSFMGGKVGSWVDGDGNHIEMGLHVFFFNYANLFALMRKVGAFENLLPKDHTHLFVNKGGDLRELDFRFPIMTNRVGVATSPSQLALHFRRRRRGLLHRIVACLRDRLADGIFARV